MKFVIFRKTRLCVLLLLPVLFAYAFVLFTKNERGVNVQMPHGIISGKDETEPNNAGQPLASAPAVDGTGLAIVVAARSQIGKTKIYDSVYVPLPYPMGDIPIEKGVCTDVVIRALRDALGMDLQQLVHEDMRKAFLFYPMRWGLKLPDKNIDHRRVLNLRTFFSRKGFSLPISDNPEDYLPGDVVACYIGCDVPHIVIVSDRKTENGVPLVIHNGGGTREEDRLCRFPVTGHYRMTHQGKTSSLNNNMAYAGSVILGAVTLAIIRKKRRKK